MQLKANYFVALLTSKKHLIQYDMKFLKLINNEIGGSFYRLISDMYSKSQCAIRCGEHAENQFL